MIKMELVQQSYQAGNETVTPADIVHFLDRSGFDLFVDHWNEQNLYFGKHGNQVMDVDRLFGSEKFKLGPSEEVLNAGALQILKHPLEAATFSHRNFLKSWTDVIAIERSLCDKMKRRWLTPEGERAAIAAALS